MKMGSITFGSVHSAGHGGRRQFEVYVDGKSLGMVYQLENEGDNEGDWVADQNVKRLLGEVVFKGCSCRGCEKIVARGV